MLPTHNTTRSRRINRSSSSPVPPLLLAILVLQIWVFTFSTTASATRALPHHAVATAPLASSSSVSETHTAGRLPEDRGRFSNTEHFRRYFNEQTTTTKTTHPVIAPSSSGGEGFEESKRKVPSCPDPLHN